MRKDIARTLAIFAAITMMNNLNSKAAEITFEAHPYWKQLIVAQYEELSDGSAKNTMNASLSGFLAITDGTELTDAQLAVLPDSYEWQIAEVDLNDVQWNGTVPAEFTGGRFWQVTIAPDFHVAPAPDMESISRTFLYANDAVSADKSNSVAGLVVGLAVICCIIILAVAVFINRKSVVSFLKEFYCKN